MPPSGERDAADATAFMAFVRAGLVESERTAVQRVGPFVARFARNTANRHLNYAIPDDGADPSRSDVDALVTDFRRRGLVPRLEYIPESAPLAEERLRAAGFIEEARLPLLGADAASIVDLPSPDGIGVVQPRDDDQLLAMVAMQDAVFGESDAQGPQAVIRVREYMAAGALAAVAIDRATGATVGAGQSSVPRSQAVELIGVAVVPSRRRQGLAGAIVSRLAREAFAAGVVRVFFEAEIGADGAYRRAGFHDASTILHVALID